MARKKVVPPKFVRSTVIVTHNTHIAKYIIFVRIAYAYVCRYVHINYITKLNLHKIKLFTLLFSLLNIF